MTYTLKNHSHVLTKIFTAISPQSVLDIGFNYGKAACIDKIFLNSLLQLQGNESESESLTKFDGIKTVPGYKEYPGIGLYDKMYEGNLTYALQNFESYECVVIGDILEHLEKKSGLEFFSECLKATDRYILVCVPIQDDSYVSMWNLEEFLPYISKDPYLSYVSNGYGVFLIDKLNLEKDVASKEKSIREKYELTYPNVDKIDLTGFSKHVANQEHRKYFFDIAFMEQYRLLAYLSTLFNDVDVFDIGTNLGYSSLALSTNNKNHVVSYDIVDLKELNEIEELKNIEYKIGNVLEDDRLIKSPLIILDTNHDGIFEEEFYSFLIKNDYKGLLFLDDIHLGVPMKNFWESITHRKEDITYLGHWSGSGIVEFS